MIVLAVRWYLRFGLSYRDVEELLAERGIQVDHVTIYRWVQRFTPLLAEAARSSRRPVGDRWWMDETYVKAGGRWRYVHRAIDQYGQVIDVYIAAKRDRAAARAFFHRVISTAGAAPPEIVTDRAPVYPKLVDELAPAAWHHCEQYANNRLEADHGLLKRRLRPMRHLHNDRTATVIIRGHASSRTYAAATTTSPPRSRSACASLWPSTNSATPSDRHYAPVEPIHHEQRRPDATPPPDLINVALETLISQ